MAVDGLPAMQPTPYRVPYFFVNAYWYTTGEACVVDDDCRNAGQRGFLGGYICREGECGTPNINMATRVYGFADRFDGDASPGQPGDLDPEDVADALGLSDDPLHIGIPCATDADCPPRSSGGPALFCDVDECAVESDRQTYDQLITRFDRRQAVLAAMRALTESTFGYDSDNLQCAFDHHEDGVTIELDHAPGQVYALNQPLYAAGFEGTVTGQGMDDTIVRTLGGGHLQPPYPFDVRPEFVIFEQGDITVSDFTFELHGITDWGSHHVLQDSISVFGFTGENNLIDDPNDESEISSRMESVRFEGQVDPMVVLGTNMIGASLTGGEQIIERDRFNSNLFHYGKPSRGDHAIVGCEFEGSFNGLTLLAVIVDGDILFEDNVGDTTVFGDPMFTLLDLDGSYAEVVDNTTTDGGLLFILEGDAASGNDLGPHGVEASAPAEILIADNETHAVNGWWGAVEMVSLRDFLGGVTNSAVTIEDNTFSSVDNFPAPFGEPFAFEGVFSRGFDDVVVRSNTFDIDGVAAVNVGLLGPWQDTGWIIDDNRYSGSTLATADVHLGVGTSGNTVISSTSRPATLQDDSGANTLVQAD